MAQLEAILDPRHSGVVQGGRGASAANAVMRQHAQGTVPKVDRDRRLVEALRRGDPNAADHLITTYGDRAYRLAIRITGNRQDAEEVVQDAFWTVVRKIETFRGEAAFGSWLYRIIANAAYQKIRSRRGRPSDLSLDEVLPFFDEEGRHVAPGADWSTRVIDESLPPDLRIALITSGLSIRGRAARHRGIVQRRDRRSPGPQCSQREDARASRPVVPAEAADRHDDEVRRTLGRHPARGRCIRRACLGIPTPRRS